MRIACLSIAPLYQDYVLGGSQRVLSEIVLGLRTNNIDVRVFSPIDNQSNDNSFIGDVLIEKTLNLKGSFPSPFEIPLYEIQDLSHSLSIISEWADRIYLHGDGWILRDEFSSKFIISGIHDLVYQESISTVFSFFSNKIIIPSKYLLETIHSSLSKENFDSKNFSVIPNSIKVNSKVKSFKSIKEKLTLLFPHRPDPRKGINEALLIANEFSKTKLWNQVILKVSKFNDLLNKDKKNSDELIDENYKDFVSNNGKVVFNDWTPYQNMNEFYSEGDLTLCPGNFIESFGLVPLESVSNLTPSICSSVGAFRNLNDFPGIEIVPYGDINAFVEKGISLLENKNCIKEGVEKIIKEYNPEEMISSYINNLSYPNIKSDHIFNYFSTEDGKYYLAPWCTIENKMVYHDYLGWIYEFKNKISLNSSKNLEVDEDLIDKSIEKRILIPRY